MPRKGEDMSLDTSCVSCLLDLANQVKKQKISEDIERKRLTLMKSQNLRSSILDGRHIDEGHVAKSPQGRSRTVV